MDKFNFEFFELVGAAIPGIPIFILTCFLVNNEPFSFDIIVASTKNINVGEAALALLTCYCIGFCLHYPAYEIFQPLAKKWGIKRTKGLPISIGKREKELVVIRKKSPNNFKVINKFMALRQMAYSMFFSLLICCLLLTIFMIYDKIFSRQEVVAIIFTLVFGFLFLRRAVAFHERIQEMITETFLAL